MQRLEVSGAVRPLLGLLGVKGLKFYLLTCFAAIAPSKYYVDGCFMTVKI